MYQQLAEEGYAPAQCKVSMVFKACGMNDKCIENLKNACDQNDPNALAQMGVYYYHGDCDLEQSHEQAFAYYRRAAELGQTKAMLNLGAMFEEGEGCEKDVHKAANIYRELTSIPSEINTEAALHLGLLCLGGELGDGTHVKAEGMVMLREAADDGNAGARELLDQFQSDNFGKRVL